MVGARSRSSTASVRLLAYLGALRDRAAHRHRIRVLKGGFDAVPPSCCTDAARDCRVR